MKSVSLLLPALVLSSWTLALSPASGQAPLSGPSPGILAMHNGQVISGKVLRDGDRYVVTLGESATLRIPVSAVEFHGQSLRQVYQFKEAAVLASDIGGQLRLAQWCIRHGLLTEAEAILARNAAHRKLPQWDDLQRRLKLARRPALASSSPSVKAVTSQSPPKLEEVMENISASSLQEFTSFVQPLLLNRCSTTTCHGALSKTPLKLIKPPRGRAIPTRYTQRNLFNTWQTLNTEKPDESPLINITTAPHGGAATLFTQREWDQYQRLVTWVRRATRKGPATMPNEIQPPTTVLTQPGPAAKNPTEQDDGRSDETDLQRAASVEAILKAPLLPKAQKQPLSAGETPKRLPGTRDPFDPDLFNRRFHAARFHSPQRSPADPTESSKAASGISGQDGSTIQER